MKIESAIILVIVSYNCILVGSSEDARIVGGTDASTKNFPYFVSTILCYKGRRIAYCGATYISPLWALTAAHCLEKIPKKDAFLELIMELDAFADNDNSSIVQKRKSSRMIMHPNYRKITVRRGKDIGLIKIQSPFSITQKAGLAILAANPVNYDGDWLVTLIGYGVADIYSKIPTPEKLQMIVVPIWKRYDCQFSILDKNTFCVGKQGAMGCFGDSGGPAIYKDVVIGVAAFVIDVDGNTCASPMTVYEDVSKHLCWIRKYVPDVKTSNAEENHINVHVIWVSLTIKILNLLS